MRGLNAFSLGLLACVAACDQRRTIPLDGVDAATRHDEDPPQEEPANPWGISGVRLVGAMTKNQQPVATVEAGGTVMLAVSTEEAARGAYAFAWTQLSPAAPQGSFSNAVGAATQWTAPAVSEDTAMILRATAADVNGERATLDFALTVTAAIVESPTSETPNDDPAPPSSKPPLTIASIGYSSTLTPFEGDAQIFTVQFADPTIAGEAGLQYSWSADLGTFSSSASANAIVWTAPAVAADQPAAIHVSVSDPSDATRTPATHTLLVIVYDGISVTNARASKSTLTLAAPAETVDLTADVSAAHGVDPATLTYQWEKVSGPTLGAFASGGTARDATWIAPTWQDAVVATPGETDYVFRLRVTDPLRPERVVSSNTVVVQLARTYYDPAVKNGVWSACGSCHASRGLSIDATTTSLQSDAHELVEENAPYTNCAGVGPRVRAGNPYGSPVFKSLLGLDSPSCYNMGGIVNDAQKQELMVWILGGASFAADPRPPLTLLDWTSSAPQVFEGDWVLLTAHFASASLEGDSAAKGALSFTWSDGGFGGTFADGPNPWQKKYKPRMFSENEAGVAGSAYAAAIRVDVADPMDAARTATSTKALSVKNAFDVVGVDSQLNTGGYTLYLTGGETVQFTANLTTYNGVSAANLSAKWTRDAGIVGAGEDAPPGAAHRYGFINGGQGLNVAWTAPTLSVDGSDDGLVNLEYGSTASFGYYTARFHFLLEVSDPSCANDPTLCERGYASGFEYVVGSVSYGSWVRYLWGTNGQTKCAVCHGASAPVQRFRLYSELSPASIGLDMVTTLCGSFRIVERGQPNSSALWKVLVNQAGACGDMSVPLYSNLTDTEKRTLKRWILTGAPFSN